MDRSRQGVGRATIGGVERTLTHTLTNQLAELGPLADAVNAFVEGHDLSPAVGFAANLAIEEMVSNIIKYGYDDKTRREITVVLALTDTRLKITIGDDSRPFDPLAEPMPDTNVPLADRSVGGLGIYLVRKSVREMRYTRKDGRNTLDIEIDLS
jgi:serine/threonine-protein kinase RsbW